MTLLTNLDMLTFLALAGVIGFNGIMGVKIMKSFFGKGGGDA